MAAVDALISLLFALGLAQLAWFSLMLHRRGIAPQQLLRAIFALFAVWVLMWPLYAHPYAVFIALGLGSLLLLFAAFGRSGLAKALKRAWAPAGRMAPLLLFWLALALTAGTFVYMPAWGLGIALALCMGEAAAELTEATGYGLRLRFPANPGQTLLGHLLFILAAAGLCAWSLHLYLALPWLAMLGTALLAAIAGAVVRAMIPYAWNLPAMALAMAGVFALL